MFLPRRRILPPQQITCESFRIVTLTSLPIVSGLLLPLTQRITKAFVHLSGSTPHFNLRSWIRSEMAIRVSESLIMSFSCPRLTLIPQLPPLRPSSLVLTSFSPGWILLGCLWSVSERVFRPGRGEGDRSICPPVVHAVAGKAMVNRSQVPPARPFTPIVLFQNGSPPPPVCLNPEAQTNRCAKWLRLLCWLLLPSFS